MDAVHRKNRYQNILNTESFNTSILDSLTTAVLMLNADHCLCHMNLAAQSLLETSNRHSHNAHINELLRNSHELVQALSAVSKSGTTIITRMVELTLANGNKILVDYSISILNELGENYFLLELHEINRSLSRTRKETLISNHETTVEMIRGLSHEIKNPLGGIRGAAQLLASELPDSQLQDYTNVIIEETDRLVNLVDRMTGAYKKPNIRPLNVHEVLERVRSVVEAETQGSIQLVRDYDPSLPEINGDLEQLIQAVLNIVRNAMQALTENKLQGREPQITLRTRAISNTTIGTITHRLIARIEIIDNGPGIAPDFLENIFYPLISGRAEGTGLGLSIAQNILKNHAGLIECESQPDKTRFILSIPFIHEGDNA